MKRFYLLTAMLNIAPVALTCVCVFEPSTVLAETNNFNFYTVNKSAFKICYDSIQKNISAVEKNLASWRINNYWAVSDKFRKSIDNLSILTYWASFEKQSTAMKIVKHFVKQQSDMLAIKTNESMQKYLSLLNGFGCYEAISLITHDVDMKNAWKSIIRMKCYNNPNDQNIGEENKFYKKLFEKVIDNIKKYYDIYISDSDIKRQLIKKNLIETLEKSESTLTHDLRIYLNQFGLLTGRTLLEKNNKPVCEPTVKFERRVPDKNKNKTGEKNCFIKINSALDVIDNNLHGVGNQNKISPEVDDLIDKQEFLSTIAKEISDKYCPDDILYPNRFPDRDRLEDCIGNAMKKIPNPQILTSDSLCWNSDTTRVHDFFFSELPTLILASFKGRQVIHYHQHFCDVFDILYRSSQCFPFHSYAENILHEQLRIDSVEAYLKTSIRTLVNQIITDENLKKECVKSLEESFDLKNHCLPYDNRSFYEVDTFINTKKSELQKLNEKQKTEKKREQQIDKCCLDLATTFNVENKTLLKQVLELIDKKQTDDGNSLVYLTNDVTFTEILAASKTFLAKYLSEFLEKYNKSGCVSAEFILNLSKKILTDSTVDYSLIKIKCDIEEKVLNYDLASWLKKEFTEKTGIDIKTDDTMEKFIDHIRTYECYSCNVRKINYSTIEKIASQFGPTETLTEYIKNLKHEDELFALAGNIRDRVEKGLISNVVNEKDYALIVKRYLNFLYKKDWSKVRYGDPRFLMRWKTANNFFLTTIPQMVKNCEAMYLERYKEPKKFNYARVFRALIAQFDSFEGESITEKTEVPKSKDELMQLVEDRAIEEANDEKNDWQYAGSAKH